jgi:hypothetical protein
MCKCGCGMLVKPASDTLDRFIDRRGTKQYPKYKQGHDKQPNFKEYHFEPTEEELQAIMGTCLGDSSLILPHGRSKNYRLVANHGLVQKAWATYKADFLGRFKISVKVVKNGGYGDYTAAMQSRCLPSLTSIAQIIYDGRTKRISTEWLDSLGDIGLAWWFCDDGSNPNKRMSFSLHTEGFNREDNELISKWFNDQGIHCRVGQYRGYYYLLFNTKGSLEFKKRINPYIPQCMQYKMDDCSTYHHK